MNPLKSGTLFAAAAQICRKRFLRSAPISHRSLSSAGGFGMSGKTRQMKKRLPLPPELSALSNVVELTCDSAACGHVYLIGTVYGSQKSCEEVKAMIEFVKPAFVFVEFCQDRAHNLEKAREGGVFYVANKEGLKHGAKVILGDRLNNITHDRFPIMAHLWDLLVSPLRITGIGISIISIAIKMVRQTDYDLVGFSKLPYDVIKMIFRYETQRILPHLERRRIALPSFYKRVVTERGQYMSAKLLEVARQHKSVVAVVGRSHLLGIQKHWKQPVDMKQLLHTPTRTRMVSRIRRVVLHYIIPMCEYSWLVYYCWMCHLTLLVSFLVYLY